MTPADLAQRWLAAPWMLVVLVALAAATTFAAWTLALPLVGPGPRQTRAGAAVVRGALAVIGLFAFLHLLDALTPILDGGPAGWLDLLAAPTGGWYGGAVVVVFGALAALLTPLAAIPAALAGRGTPSSPTAPIPWTMPALLAAPLLGLGAAWPALSVQNAAVPGLDLLGALPVLCAALAWAQRQSPPEPAVAPGRPSEAPTATPTTAPATSVAPDAAWRASGALAAGDRAFLRTPAVHQAGGIPVATEAWRALGLPGSPPSALDVVLGPRPAEVDGRAWLVPDLSAPSDRLLLAAAARATVARGRRVVWISEDVASDADLLVRATGDLGRVGAGPAALREALAAGTAPAVVVLDPEDLLHGALRQLADPTVDATGALLATLGLICLPDVDRGAPLAVTHRAFLLRRAALLLRQDGVDADVLATGHGGRGGLGMLTRAWPTHAVQRLPLGPRETAEVSTWLCDWRFQNDPRGPWLLRAAQTAAQAGATRVDVCDPTGQLDAADLQPLGDQARLHRRPALGGEASVARLDAVALMSAVRALGQRVALTDGDRHTALWGLVDEPVTRFLAKSDHLASLLARGKLPAPEPVVGHANRAIGRAHVQAALGDARQTPEALAVAFGPSLVDEVLRDTALTPTSFEARIGRDGVVSRSPRLPVPATAHRPAPTVTEQRMTLVDPTTGAVVDVVDALLAPTRYYPKRVFQLGGRRWEVPMHAHDQRRERIEVVAVPPDRPTTTPRLTVRATARELVRAPQDVHQGPLRYRTGSFDVTVEEAVTGVRRGAAEGVQYPTVATRYRSRALLVALERHASDAAMAHLAAEVSDVLRAHVCVDEDDVAVIPVPAGWAVGWTAGVLVVDRHVQGLGLDEAIDEHVLQSVLSWVWAILHGCDCARGCAKCTPPEVLEDGRIDKAGVLGLLGA